MERVTSPVMSDSAAETFHFSKQSVSDHDRLAAWREILNNHFLRLDTNLIEGDGHHSATCIRFVCAGVRFASLGIVGSDTSGMRIARTRQTLADGKDSIRLIMLRPSSGSGLVTQGRKNATVYPGQAFVVSNAHPHTVVYPKKQRIVSLTLGRDAMRPLTHDFDSIFVRAISHQVEALRLLMAYSDALLTQPPTTPDVCHAAANHLVDLAALAFGATRDAAHLAESRGLRSARLHAIKSDVLKHLASPALAVNEVAARLHISPRYIQMLFNDEETTFSEFVVRQRLMRAWRMLTDPRFADRSITSVAFDCGFGDLSYFNRTFRRQFGYTPTDARFGRTKT